MPRHTAEQQGALQRVRDYLEPLLGSASLEVSRQMAVQYWGSTAGWRCDGDNIRRPSGEHAELLVKSSVDDPAAWQAAAKLAAILLERGEIVPPVLAGWAAAVLRGKAKPPKDSSDGFKRLSRDLPLCMAISMLLEAGFSRSEGDLFAIAEVSIMAEELGHRVGPDMLAKIWGRYRVHIENARSKGPFYFREEPGNFPLPLSCNTARQK